ncbi:MAG TPA: hypothetical protein VFG04_21900 [Planctomycetaceae bacterium]|nr:hypothetical protein [Planctomycetaceae bacterium]
MKASRDAATAMLERASVVTAKRTMVDHGQAVRNVSAVIEKYGPTPPSWRPRRETPAEAGIEINQDSRCEGQPDVHHDAGRRRQDNKARVGNKHRAPKAPGVVIGNVNDSRIHGHNVDDAGVHHYTLLRCGDESVRLLRLQPHGLNRIHDVTGLVVIGIA